MKYFYLSVLYLILMISLVSCVSATEKEKGRVVCPACGNEFDALYQKRF